MQKHVLLIVACFFLILAVLCFLGGFVISKSIHEQKMPHPAPLIIHTNAIAPPAAAAPVAEAPAAVHEKPGEAKPVAAPPSSTPKPAEAPPKAMAPAPAPAPVAPPQNPTTWDKPDINAYGPAQNAQQSFLQDVEGWRSLKYKELPPAENRL